MPRLYANENFPLPIVLELRRLAHDVLTMLETDRADQRTTDWSDQGACPICRGSDGVKLSAATLTTWEEYATF